MAVVADEGYHAATHQRIAEAAGLVRTAINYHFPDPDILADAIVDHLHRLKAERLMAVIGRSLDDHPTLAIEVYWALLQETPFVAIAELECCARTDAALRGRLAAAKERRPAPAVEDAGLCGVSLRLLDVMARGGTQHDGADRLLDLLKRAVLASDGLLSAA